MVLSTLGNLGTLAIVSINRSITDTAWTRSNHSKSENVHILHLNRIAKYHSNLVPPGIFRQNNSSFFSLLRTQCSATLHGLMYCCCSAMISIRRYGLPLRCAHMDEKRSPTSLSPGREQRLVLKQGKRSMDAHVHVFHT